MSDLISRSELINYIDKERKQIPIDSEKYNIDSNVVDGMVSALQAFENKVKEVESAYDVDKVVRQLNLESIGSSIQVSLGLLRAIEIVKQGGVSEDVCEWRLCDEEANVYDTSCRNPHILIEGTPKENNYEYCPYCGKKIKVVE